jgi:hypothetical protein
MKFSTKELKAIQILTGSCHNTGEFGEIIESIYQKLDEHFNYTTFEEPHDLFEQEPYLKEGNVLPKYLENE